MFQHPVSETLQVKSWFDMHLQGLPNGLRKGGVGENYTSKNQELQQQKNCFCH